MENDEINVAAVAADLGRSLTPVVEKIHALVHAHETGMIGVPERTLSRWPSLVRDLARYADALMEAVDELYMTSMPGGEFCCVDPVFVTTLRSTITPERDNEEAVWT